MKSAQPKITVRIQRGIWFNVRLIRCTRLPSPIKFSIGCSFARLVLRFKPFELVFALHIHLFPNYFAFPYVFFSAVAIFGYCYYVRINKRFVISSCVLHFSFIFFVQLLCCGRWWVSGLTLLRYVILLFLSAFIFSLSCAHKEPKPISLNHRIDLFWNISILCCLWKKRWTIDVNQAKLEMVFFSLLPFTMGIIVWLLSCISTHNRLWF